MYTVHTVSSILKIVSNLDNTVYVVSNIVTFGNLLKIVSYLASTLP